MKCDELKALVFSISDLAYVDEPTPQPNFQNPHDHAVYKATEVDALLAEKEKEIEKEKITVEKLKQFFSDLREAFDCLDMDGMEKVMQQMENYQYEEEQSGIYEQLKDAVAQIDADKSEEILQLWETHF